MLDHLLDAYGPLTAHVIVVTSPLFSAEMNAWSARHAHVSLVEQSSPTGMLDAVLLAAPVVHRQQADAIWVTWADQIGILPETIQRLANVADATPTPALALPTVRRPHPYIHFTRDAQGRIAGLLQKREHDVMPPEGESDMGLFALGRDIYDTELPRYAADAPTGHGTAERNFLPFVPWLAQRRTVVTVSCTDPMEAVGINTPEELGQVEAWLRARSR
jgi:bifunctional N-acetylglucosamine-1-phosphate-uridyltransferase/glucosamine-1-phosphate-acetyltransferase GlmU-like protein